jgi:hypothetical protein
MINFSNKTVEKLKHFMFSNFFPENRAFCERTLQKIGGAIGAEDDNMAARCMLYY